GHGRSDAGRHPRRERRAARADRGGTSRIGRPGPARAEGVKARRERSTAGKRLRDARLTLAEFLLTTEDLIEISQMSLDWLSRHAGVPRSLCLVPPDDYATSLVTIASHGIAPTSATFTLNLDETEHPLVKAWTSAQPVTLPPTSDARRSSVTPIGHGAVQALP